MDTKKHRIAIIGSGPAGLSAGIYTSRAEIETTIFAGEEPGGQLTKTTEIENYPGLVGKTGPEMMVEMTEQARRFGSLLIYETVTSLRPTANSKQLELTTNAGTEYQFDAIILAMGASPKLLGVGEDKYWGKGFSTCAVCDAAFYKNKKVYVVGGGDAAIEDAWALTKFAGSVTMLVRGSEFRASRIMQKRVFDNPDKIKVMWKTNLLAIEGERVERLVIDVEGSRQTVEAEGLFLAIGHTPATAFLKETGVALDEQGYVLINSQISNSQILKSIGYPMMTSIEGVFAAGDCFDSRYRQAATAAGMGVQAALDCERWLANTTV